MPANMEPRFSWDFFDHTVTRSLSSKNNDEKPIATKIFYERSSFTPHVVRSCEKTYVSENQRDLVEFAKSTKSFIQTRFNFILGDTFYVVSQVADICLADIIPCTLEITEVHAASIINQVRTLLYSNPNPN